MAESTMLTVDIVLFTIQNSALNVLLIKRLVEPFAGRYALPGGFVLQNETLEDAAIRELREETGFDAQFLEQLRTFGDPGRDPRGRVVTVAYYALVSSAQSIQAGSDAQEAKWFAVTDLPSLAFDHSEILSTAHNRLKGKLEYTSLGFELLPELFTLTELQEVHEAILGYPLDKRNFRRRMEMQHLVEETEERKPTGRKPARLYRFSGAS
jgi:8-oxo-dGTP diphosphatase